MATIPKVFSRNVQRLVWIQLPRYLQHSLTKTFNSPLGRNIQKCFRKGLFADATLKNYTQEYADSAPYKHSVISSPDRRQISFGLSATKSKRTSTSLLRKPISIRSINPVILQTLMALRMLLWKGYPLCFDYAMRCTRLLSENTLLRLPDQENSVEGRRIWLSTYTCQGVICCAMTM